MVQPCFERGRFEADRGVRAAELQAGNHAVLDLPANGPGDRSIRSATSSTVSIFCDFVVLLAIAAPYQHDQSDLRIIQYKLELERIFDGEHGVQQWRRACKALRSDRGAPKRFSVAGIAATVSRAGGPLSAPLSP